MRELARSLALALVLGLLCLLCLQVAAAPPRRAILVVFDSTDLAGSSVRNSLIERLLKLRAEGAFKKFADLNEKFQSYDAGLESHRQAIKSLGLTGSPLPYLALVQLGPQGLPSKLVWGRSLGQVDKTVEELLHELDPTSGPGPATSAVDQLETTYQALQSFEVATNVTSEQPGMRRTSVMRYARPDRIWMLVRKDGRLLELAQDGFNLQVHDSSLSQPYYRRDNMPVRRLLSKFDLDSEELLILLTSGDFHEELIGKKSKVSEKTVGQTRVIELTRDEGRITLTVDARSGMLSEALVAIGKRGFRAHYSYSKINARFEPSAFDYIDPSRL